MNTSLTASNQGMSHIEEQIRDQGAKNIFGGIQSELSNTRKIDSNYGSKDIVAKFNLIIKVK